KCLLYKSDVYRHVQGSLFVVIPPDSLNEAFDFDPGFKNALKEYRESLGTRLSLAASRHYNGTDAKRLSRLARLSKTFDIPLVATNDVHYHHPLRRELQDVLTCIREKCTLYNAGFRLYPNAERHLKTGEEMLRLFRQYPDAIRQTHEIAEACRFSLDELRYQYPKEVTSEGRTPQEELTHLCWQ